MTIPTLTTANTFGELINDTQQLIQLMNFLTDGAQFNANTNLVLTKLTVSNLQLQGSAIGGLNTASVIESTTNLYFTAARTRANVSNTGPITYDATNGIFGLASSGVTANSYGDSTHIVSTTIDQYGRITSAANVKIQQPTYKNFTLISTRSGINFLPGANISLGITDDSANDLANITIDGVWGGGPNPLGFTTFIASGTVVSSNTNTVNFLVGDGMTVVGSYNPSGLGSSNITIGAANIYAQANAAFAEANSAAAAANTVATAAKIRANVSNTAPVTYDAANGIFGLATSGVTPTTYGNTTYVASFTVDQFGRLSSASNVAINYTGARAVLSNTAPLLYDSTNGIFSIAASGAAGSYGDSTHVTSITVDGVGRVTAASSVAISYNGARSVLSNTAPINYDTTNGIFSHASSGVTATGYGDSISIPTFVVNATGHVTSAANVTIRTGSTSQTGVVSLTDSNTSSSTTTAATPNAVRLVDIRVTAVIASLGTMASQSSSAVSISGGTISGTQINATRLTEQLNTFTPGASGSVTVDWLSAGGSKITTNGTNTVSFTNIPSGTAGHVVYTDNFNNVSWPAAVTWGLGGKPSIAGAAVVTLTTFDGGTTIYGSISYRAA